jgi:Leucine-rich repeat (LRR) protein
MIMAKEGYYINKKGKIKIIKSNITWLDLCHLEIFEIVCNDNLKYLNCVSSQINRLVLNSKLEFLYCWNNNIKILNGIENCVNLQRLACENNNLTSLKGIENCSKLEWLHSDDIIDIQEYKNKIKDIEIYL